MDDLNKEHSKLENEFNKVNEPETEKSFDAAFEKTEEFFGTSDTSEETAKEESEKIAAGDVNFADAEEATAVKASKKNARSEQYDTTVFGDICRSILR